MARHGPVLAVLLCTFCCMGLARGAAPSLYSRLGGADAVDGFVREAIDRAVASDSERQQLASFIRTIAAGNDPGLRAPQITEAQFLVLVEGLRVAMRAKGVPLAARNELLEALAPLRRES